MRNNDKSMNLLEHFKYWNKLSALGLGKEGDQWGDLGVDGWIIFGWISRMWDVGIWTGLGWPRIETGDGPL